MPPKSREALAERIAHEELLKARLARLEGQYDRLEEGLILLETEMAIEGAVSADAIELESAKAKKPRRRYAPRKPR